MDLLAQQLKTYLDAQAEYQTAQQVLTRRRIEQDQSYRQLVEAFARLTVGQSSIDLEVDGHVYVLAPSGFSGFIMITPAAEEEYAHVESHTARG